MKTITCVRCGNERVVTVVRDNPKTCYSCRAKAVVTVHGPHGKCLPWRGAFADDDVTPIDSVGNPVLPGRRVCGHSDCVSQSHVVDSEIQ